MAMTQRLGAAVGVSLLVACTTVGHARDYSPDEGFYATKTPYAPQQDAHAYESPPAGFRPVFTQLVARHGARSLDSARDIHAVKELLSLARRENALTELGRMLELEAASFEHANVTVGYGNLSGLGVMEHQQLAARLLTRMPDLFADAIADGRRIAVLTSGKDRAVDSGKNFVASLKSRMPELDRFIDPAIADTDLLYFHKAPQNADYQDWLAHDPTRAAKLHDIAHGPESRRYARRLLLRLFSPAFVDRLGAGTVVLSDAETGEPRSTTDVGAAMAVYAWYQAEPGLSEEGHWGFDRFVHGSTARWFAYLADATEFYDKGPSFAGADITFKMAQVLQDDFFTAVEAIHGAGRRFAAKLRFAHAEIVIPFAALMQLPYSDRQVPADETYTYANNPWRGATVSPYAVNIQWDVYEDAGGQLLVRMLYNEAQMRFKATCDSIRPDSFFYGFDELKRCYGYATP
jgi:hypothetical protein